MPRFFVGEKQTRGTAAKLDVLRGMCPSHFQLIDLPWRLWQTLGERKLVSSKNQPGVFKSLVVWRYNSNPCKKTGSTPSFLEGPIADS